ncbi:MAG: alpha-2-macroglobulin, partial [Proteobacteria bacterium]|nr:alpha-2-macroglobulin [Pseudomonadota bacterium]
DIARWIARVDDNDRIDARYDDEKDRWIIRNDGVARSLFDKDDVTSRIGVPVAANGKAFEVVGIPLKAPGFYVVELASPRLGAALFGQPRPYYARAATLVTNLAVHFKRGGENSLVWVTHLDDATPAASADVDVLDCAGRTYWHGRTDAQGIARIDRALPDTGTLAKCNSDGRRAYIVVAKSADDMAFAYSDWDQGIAPWRFNVPTADARTSAVAHAVLDRTLLRAGDTVGIKVFVRRQTGAGFALAAADTLDGTLVLRHQGSDRHFDVPVTWTGTRYGTATFAIPRDAPLGTYDISIRDRLGGRDLSERSVGTFRVEEFRVPLMRARIQAVGGPFVDTTSVPLDIGIAYLSGGPAGGLPVTLRTQTRARSVDFAGYDDYAFAAGDVHEGRSTHGADSADDEDDDASASAPGAADSPVSTTPLTLDANGGARTMAAGIARADRPRELVAEVEYRDPNGETSTAATRVPLWTASLVLGIKPDGWFARKDRLKFTVAALDTAGKPVANTHVSVDAFARETFSHRRRLIGGFYAFENGSETKRLGAFCDGTTDAHGLLICDAPAPAGGTLVMRAQASDGSGRTAVTQREFFVASGDDGWFDASDNDRIDLLPEQKQLMPGDIARLQVRTPFKDATVLVTVEREGVLDAFVAPLSRANPIIEVPIKPAYAPNVYISALVVRGRIADVQPTALVDLGKPTFKMGLAALRVGWTAHALDVKVATDRPVYRTRDTVTVDVEVKRADGGALPAGADVALAAVDEGLLELLPNDSWKLLDAMMAERGLDVDTATASMQVIGRRHFGRKAVATGGGGGRSSARELFDTLLAWRPSVPLDASGHARITVPLNDSLTSFRIVAVADAGAQWFGTGATSIRTTQPLMLLSGLPQGVREGDRLRAGFTVRNASDVAQHVDVTASATTAAGTTLPALAPMPLDLAPGASRTLGWDVVVPDNTTSLAWRVDAKAVSGEGASAQTYTDALKVTLPVTAVVPERTYQATLFQLAAPQNIPVARPADALPGRGGIAVTAQNKLAGEMPGVAEYLARYPFDCFEQLASVAIGLRDRARWDALMARMPAYVDRDGLVRYWPFLVRGDDALTAYVYSVADEAGYPLPDDLRAQLERGLVGFVEGRIVRGSALPTADLTLRKLAALEALSRRKAAFSPRWLDSITIEPQLWPTSAVIDWYWILKREPALPQRDTRMAEAQDILRARLNFQGTTMNFSTERNDALWWLMVNGDVNANRLVLALVDAPAWKEDMPRLVRGSLGRMQRGRWSTTVANAWGVLALERFSATFEKTPVTGAVAATLGDAVRTEKFAGGTAFETHTARLPWPAARTDLGLAHVGDGAPWVTLASIAAIPLTTPLSSGYALQRTITPVQQKDAGHWSVGDVARIRLDIDAQTDMTWVALVDAIPSGATILGRGFGTDSTIATQGERHDAGPDPTFDQRGARDYRAFWQYLPKGKAGVEYTVRLNNAGTFALPGTRAEAMYAPELFGELPGTAWSVQP